MNYFALPLICVLFISCTSPALKEKTKPAEETIIVSDSEPAPEINETDPPTSKVTPDGDIHLDPVGAPIIVYDEYEDCNDTLMAIDDYIWRQLNLAHEYYLMGVLANSEALWEEAEYYFEKSLSILGDLDIETEADSLSEEGAKYNRTLSEIIANYKITLVSLGRLPSDVSADALLARFSELNNLHIDSTEFGRLDDYAREKVAYNVPIIMNERVKNCILYYQTVARDAFERYLRRSTKFIPMIDEIFTEHGLPTDLKYLALVESGYNPKAYSWARAMGLWQFIASTGRLYKMYRNWWYDERRDPVKATHAAARFLKDLYEDFGDWNLAMAAYNGGPGRISRTIKKQKTRDFWKLRLKKQTMDYVPFFMAATIISKDPEKFGFTDINYEPEWVYDEVLVDKCLDLAVVGKSIGCSVKELQKLNPELLRQFTPPNKNKYTLRIPKGSKSKFVAAYEKMPSSKQTSWVKHRIKKGETVSTIARKYGVSQYAIFSANNLSRRSKIYAGKNLVVPVPNDRNYSSSRSRRSYDLAGNLYVVRSGDNVWDIANAFNTSPDKIRRLNNLDRKARIYVGQKLRIYADGDQQLAETNQASVSTGGTYTVRKGDSLWEIANRLGTTISVLRRLNGLGRRSYIYPGQKLIVPGTVTQDGRFIIYTVKRGDTISNIATMYRTTVSKIAQWNGLRNPSRINPGEQLRIYTN
jgi:membrane-bound lytic murein transglycosylase D